MKIHYASDIHLEFGTLDQPMPVGDVMILAGDITLLNCLDPDDDDYHRRAELRERTQAFFNAAAQNFGRVFYFCGNHECYDYDITLAAKTIRKALPMVELLDSRAVKLGDDVTLVGGTLWTDMDGGKAHRRIGNNGLGAAMNDFNIIWKSAKAGTSRFTTHDAVAFHQKTMKVITKAAEDNPDQTIVVATHHAPTYKGINPEHSGSSLNAGYATNLESFIRDHQNIRHWIFGHTHMQKEFKVGRCQLHSNARGYIGRERSAETFDINRHFEIGKNAKRLLANSDGTSASASRDRD